MSSNRISPHQGENACLPPAANTSGESLAARAAGGQGAGTVDYEPAECTQCGWEGPLCNAEFFCHRPPDVVIGCRFCGGSLKLSRVEMIREAMVQDRSDSWADFRKHWPMYALRAASEFGVGVVLGLALSLAAFVYALDLVARV